MEFLSNPNIAYLLLVTTTLLVWSAIATPGTGALEVAALFCLILTGWAAALIPINAWAVVILLLAVVPFVMLRRTRKTIFLVLGILALEIGSALLFITRLGEQSIHPLLIILVAVSTGAYYWITTLKVLEAADRPPTHNLERLLGQSGEARTALSPTGTVYVDGELWSALSADDTIIAAGQPVRVTGREGFILLVEPLPERGAPFHG